MRAKLGGQRRRQAGRWKGPVAAGGLAGEDVAHPRQCPQGQAAEQRTNPVDSPVRVTGVHLASSPGTGGVSAGPVQILSTKASSGRSKPAWSVAERPLSVIVREAESQLGHLLYGGRPVGSRPGGGGAHG